MVLYVLAWWSEGDLNDKVGFLIKQVGNLVIEPTIPESWSGFFVRILLICALRTQNSKPILEKSLLGIKNKTFLKIDLLIYALRAHINRTFFAKTSRMSFGFLGVLHFLKKQISC